MKKYIKILKDDIISLNINNEKVDVKANDVIIISDNRTYLNELEIVNCHQNIILYGLVIFNRDYITIYNESEYRNIKLKLILDA